jgi:hypothetical protein
MVQESPCDQLWQLGEDQQKSPFRDTLICTEYTILSIGFCQGAYQPEEHFWLPKSYNLQPLVASVKSVNICCA